LASQGFKVAKMDSEQVEQSHREEDRDEDPLALLHNHPRKNEVVKFVGELERLSEHLNKQKGDCSLNYQRIDQ
jgi:hypothetical protein